MQLVSAVKMKKAQQVEVDGRPYRDHLSEILGRVMPGIDLTGSVLTNAKTTDSNKTLVIMISSNKGLCGAFNVSLFRFILKNLDVKKSDFITVGKKGASFVSRTAKSVVADYSVAKPLYEVPAIFQLALDKFLRGEYSRIQLVYNKFISTLRFETTMETLLPFEYKFEAQDEKNKISISNNYLVEPSSEEIVDQLLQSYIEEKIRGAIISSEAVEHSARMIAMKNATDNANDVIYNFTLLGNKLRQEKITGELLDMITAKESVEGA